MLWKIREKFQSKIMALLALGIIVPVSLVSAYSISSSSQALSNSTSKQMQIQGEDGAKILNIILDNVKAEVLYLSGTPPVQGIVRAQENNGFDPQDKSSYTAWIDRLNIIFSSFLKTKPYYDKLRYLDENGNELVRVTRNGNNVEVVPLSQLQNNIDSEYFRETIKLNSGELYDSPINLNQENGKIQIPYKPVIRFATPIFSKEGNRKGIVIADILVEHLFELTSDEQLESALKQRFVVVNQQGYYLYHPDEDKTWGFQLNKPNQVVQKDYPKDVAEQILSGNNGFIDKGLNDFISYHTVYPGENNENSNPFVLIYETPKEVVFKPINNFKIIAFIVTIVSLGVILALSIIILRQVLVYIRNLMGTVSSFSDQVLSTINEQERTANQQAASVNETTTTMNELGASSRQSAIQAESAATAAQMALSMAQQGNQAVEETLEEMSDLKNKVGAIAEQIVHLSEQTNQIGNISQLVSDIANQTNMLALNAAVEAVRAGEHGKGFAVVASEIRKLADQSKKSAEKINNLVGEIQNSINSTVMVTDEGTKTVNTGMEVSQKTAQAFAGVSETVNNVVMNNQQISLNIKQQAIAIEQVLQAMNTINQGAKETASGITQTRVGTEKLNEATENLKTLV